MQDCIFCKIINGQVPNHTVYEDDNFLAFLDIFPHALGHTVVIPKEHRNNFMELTDTESEQMILAVKRAMEKIQIVLNPDGFNIGWNEKLAGGQVVPHLHVHIFPRFENDGGTSVHSIIKNPGTISVSELAERFIK